MGGRFSIRKLFLDLLVIVCLVVAGWVGYRLFFSHELDPVMGSIIFIVDLGVLIWNIAVLRNHYYKRMHPSFKMVFLPLLAIIVILSFAGVQPLSSYKGLVVDRVTSVIDGFKGDTSMDGDVKGEEKTVSLSGEYVAILLGMEQRWVFRGDTATRFDAFEGKRVFKYVIENNTIRMTDVVTGVTSTVPFKYSSEDGYIQFDTITYWKD